jgi:hypothetical protein
LNAASLVDLLAVPGVTRSVAEAILDAAPFARVDDIDLVPGVTPALAIRFREMASRMEIHFTNPDNVETELVLDLRAILMPYAWRASGAIGFATILGALLCRLVLRSTWFRCGARGLGAASVGLAAAWLLNAPPAAAAIAVPVILFGGPEALWKLARSRKPGLALRALTAWIAACLPAALLVQPLL